MKLPVLSILGLFLATITNVHADDLAQTCEIQRSKTEIECPKVPPPKLPRKCAGFSASWSGDPHFHTFDKVKYDCQGEGEFDVIKSMDSDFRLQARFEKYHPKRRPTVTTALLLNTGDGEPRAQVNVRLNDEDRVCEPFVFLGGNQTTIPDEGATIDGIRIQKTRNQKGGGLIFYYEESELQLQVWSTWSQYTKSCYLAADICLPDCYARSSEQLVGLLGTPDNNKENEWTARDGESVIKLQAENHKAEYDYCVRNWCINDPKESLFAYETGKHFDHYNKCGLKAYNENENCAANVKKLEQLCGTENRECIVDGCAGGEEAARDSVKNALNMMDKNCGKEVFFENFDGDVDYSAYGDVLEKGASRVKNAKQKTKYLSLSVKKHHTVKKAFDIPKDTTIVVAEYLFYEIGGWEARGRWTDRLNVNINNVNIDIGCFDGKANDKAREGVTKGIAWGVKPITQSGQLGFKRGNGRDQIYKVVIQVPKQALGESWKLNFEMSVDMTGGLEDESAGIDDLRITAFQESCTIDCEGVTVLSEDFDSEEYAEDASSWGKMKKISDGNFILGILQQDSKAISKTFEVSEFAGLAKIEFLLYQFGSWNEQPFLKFLVTIGGVQFDLGPFLPSEEPTAVTTDTIASQDGAISWRRKPFVGPDGASLTNGKEHEIYQVELQVSRGYFSDGYLSVGFDVESEDGGDAGAGIDEFKIRLFPEHEKCKKAEAKAEATKEVRPEINGTRCPGKKGPQIPKKCYREDKQTVCTPTTPNPTTTPPTRSPTVNPSTSSPTVDPTTLSPTTGPTVNPTTSSPTVDPTTLSPTAGPTINPNTSSPTVDPSTHSPTALPTVNPSTPFPTVNPSTPSPTTRPTPTDAPTDPPRTVKTPAPTPKGSSSGDPHFKTWTGDKFDYHGECDLVLVSNPSFGNGKGLRLHIRTTRVKYFSFIEKVALQIGKDILEFDNDAENFLINGKPVEANRLHHKTMLSGYIVRRDKKAISVRLQDGGTSFDRQSGNIAKIDFHTRKNGFPAVIVDAGHSDLFEGSLGLLGEWGSGRKLARDGKTEYKGISGPEDDASEFALEWQVRPNEPRLFQDKFRMPQFPLKCFPPTARRGGGLGASLFKQEAEEACAHWKQDMDECIFDVMATRDVLVAEEGHIVHIE